MANRYWVGGTGTWDYSDTTHWSTVSGGAGGATAPTGVDTVYLDANSGSGTITANFSDCWILDCTGYTGTLDLGNSYPMINKNLKFSTSMTLTAGTATLTMNVNGTGTLDLAGKTVYRLQTQAFSDITLLSDVTCSDNCLIQGTFLANGYNITAASFTTGGTYTRKLELGTSTVTLTGTGTVWDLRSQTNLAFSGASATIVLSNTSASARTFYTGNFTYGKLTIGGATGSSNTTISGNATFAELASTKTVAHTLTFSSGSTYNIGKWSITGTAGNVVTVAPSSTTNYTHYTLNYTGSTPVSVDYLSISRATATPAYSWYAGAHSTDGGNNTGWIFSAAPALAGLFFGAVF